MPLIARNRPVGSTPRRLSPSRTRVAEGTSTSANCLRRRRLTPVFLTATATSAPSACARMISSWIGRSAALPADTGRRAVQRPTVRHRRWPSSAPCGPAYWHSSWVSRCSDLNPGIWPCFPRPLATTTSAHSATVRPVARDVAQLSRVPRRGQTRASTARLNTSSCPPSALRITVRINGPSRPHSPDVRTSAISVTVVPSPAGSQV